MSLLDLGRKLWTGVDGAAQYALAVARGDIADDETAAARAARCAACPAHTQTGRVICGHMVQIGWCGKRLDPKPYGPDGWGKTCGCMVYQRVGADEVSEGEATAAGATMVKSKMCPRGEW